jgi:hypothetical protein
VSSLPEAWVDPAVLRTLPAPDPRDRVDHPVPGELLSSSSVFAPAAAPPAALGLPAPPQRALGRARGVAGTTRVSGNRVALLLRTAGAKLEALDGSAARFAVKGVTIVVQSGEPTTVHLDGSDERARTSVAEVIGRMVRVEDTAFEFRASSDPAPSVNGSGGSSRTPGWFPDPFVGGGWRWWDGVGWTTETRARAEG